jgi:diaminopimelate epimerase
MRFTKMHGLGNDYIYVHLTHAPPDDPASLARAVSDRHTGVGGDGLIFIGPSRVADVRMEMYNADGSRGRMCGNGIRCVAKYVVDHGVVRGPALRIETDAGVKNVQCTLVGGRVTSVRVDMGKPELGAQALPSTIAAESIIEYPLRVGGGTLRITCVSMGNPHAVHFVEDLDKVRLEELGPTVERAAEFPERINLHIVRVEGSGRVAMKTWERGSGATRACGTGACAVCVAGALTRRTGRSITASLPGGELEIEWAADDQVYMTGPAVEVFTGDWPTRGDGGAEGESDAKKT